MRSLARLAAYFVSAVVAVTVVALVVAVVLEYDVAHTISLALIVTGAVVGAFGVFTSIGPPLPDFPGLEHEYVRHVHHRDGAARRAWQDERLLLVLGGAALAAVGGVVALL